MSTIQEQAYQLMTEYNKKIVDAKTALWERYLDEGATEAAPSIVSSVPSSDTIIFKGFKNTVDSIDVEYKQKLSLLGIQPIDYNKYKLITDYSDAIKTINRTYIEKFRTKLLDNSIRWHKVALDNPSWTVEQLNQQKKVYSDKNVILRERLSNTNYTEDVIAPRTTSVINQTQKFTDVSTSHWAFDSIMTLYDLGAIKGITDNAYNPEGYTTRAQAATIFVRTLNFQTIKPETTSFTDTDKNAWYHQFIETAYKYGAMDGYPDGTFKPNAEMTREEFVHALCKAKNVIVTESDSEIDSYLQEKFNDSSSVISSFAKKSIYYAVKNGWIKGYDDNTFKPGNSIKRSEVAAIASKSLINKKEIALDKTKAEVRGEVAKLLNSKMRDYNQSYSLNKSDAQRQALLDDYNASLALWNSKLQGLGILSIQDSDLDKRNIAEYKKLLSPIIDDKKSNTNSNVQPQTRATAEYYKSFSGTDAVAALVFPNEVPVVLGEVSTLSYSIYRDKKPIITLGRISPKGFVKSSRTIAGTIVFSTLNKHWVNVVRDSFPNLFSEYGKLKADELPPFDIVISLGNEYGASAFYVLYAVTILEEAQILSVEDAMMQNVCKFMARDIDLVDKPPDGEISGTVVKRSKYAETLPRFKVSYDTTLLSNGAQNSNPLPKYSYVYSDDDVERSMGLLAGSASTSFTDTMSMKSGPDLNTYGPYLLNVDLYTSYDNTAFPYDANVIIYVTYLDNSVKEYEQSYTTGVSSQVPDSVIFEIDAGVGNIVNIKAYVEAPVNNPANIPITKNSDKFTIKVDKKPLELYTWNIYL